MWVVRHDPCIGDVQTLVSNVAFFVDRAACLVRIVRFWVEAFAMPFIVETPNFLVWIRAFVLQLLVVDHGFAGRLVSAFRTRRL